jgi:predicted nucleic acid-binding protein
MAPAAGFRPSIAEAVAADDTGKDRHAHTTPGTGSQTSTDGAPVSEMYLLDTNVVSELRKQKPHGGVVQWIQDTAEAELHVSAVTIGEIQAGIELTRDQDRDKATELEAWLELVAGSFNVIPMDAAAFRAWARLMHRASDTLYEDAIIAATAKVHHFTVVTRNVTDFKHFGVPVLNPFITARR